MYSNFKFEMRNYDITGYLWHVDNPAKVMCIIHGIGEYGGRYERMASFLNDKGIAVVSMDLRGHGLSEGVRGHAAPRGEVLSDVDAMIHYAEYQYPGVPIVLYGHSYGGNICLDYRYRGEKNSVPEKFIVSSPWVRLVNPITNGQYMAAKALSKIFPEFSVSSGCHTKKNNGKPVFKDPLVHDRITVLCAVDGFEVGRSLYEGTLKNNHRADKTPVLLMHGTSDRTCSIEGSRRVYILNKDSCDFRFVEWPGYYHEIHNGGGEADGSLVLEAIRNFVLETV